MSFILLVEDRDTHQEMIASMLRSIGFEDIEVCATQAEVQDVLRARNESPDGVLLDLSISSPPADTTARLEYGRDCGVYLRSNTLTEDVPIIAYSAYTDDERVLGWADLLRFSEVFAKNHDPYKKIENAARKHFSR